MINGEEGRLSYSFRDNHAVLDSWRLIIILQLGKKLLIESVSENLIDPRGNCFYYYTQRDPETRTI